MKAICKALEKYECNPDMTPDESMICVNFNNIHFHIFYTKETDYYSIVFEISSDPWQVVETLHNLERIFGRFDVDESYYYSRREDKTYFGEEAQDRYYQDLKGYEETKEVLKEFVS